jgi:uncharacterized protein (DUF2384 family)
VQVRIPVGTGLERRRYVDFERRQTMTSRTRDNIVQSIFDLSANELEQAILERTVIGQPPLNEIINKMAELLGINKVDVVSLLGISSAQEISKATVTTDVLDRAYTTIEMFARVANILGEGRVHRWFQEPKKVLEGARPLDLLQTRVGLDRLKQVLTALEDGAFL